MTTRPKFDQPGSSGFANTVGATKSSLTNPLLRTALGFCGGPALSSNGGTSTVAGGDSVKDACADR
jgi:hypothetical protein